MQIVYMYFSVRPQVHYLRFLTIKSVYYKRHKKLQLSCACLAGAFSFFEIEFLQTLGLILGLLEANEHVLTIHHDGTLYQHTIAGQKS